MTASDTEAEQADIFARCDRCYMRVRRSELDIHLAHYHNIGPTAKGDRGKSGRGKRRRSDED